MPLFKMFSKTKSRSSADKNRFTQKCEESKANPNEIFDISKCELDEIPEKVFAWIKVCRKEVFLLNNNNLKDLCNNEQLMNLSLLVQLDVSSNNLHKLPSDFVQMQNLRVLKLHDNKFKEFPLQIPNLRSLENLDISANIIVDLPESLCNLITLNVLNIKHNCITRLPSNMSLMRNLNILLMDDEIFIWPPRDVCAKGIYAILAYLQPSSDWTDNFACSREQERSSRCLEKQKNIHLNSDLENTASDSLTQNEKASRQRDILLNELKCDDETRHNEYLILQQQKEEERSKLRDELFQAEIELSEAVLKTHIKQDNELTLLKNQWTDLDAEYLRFVQNNQSREANIKKWTQEQETIEKSNSAKKWMEEYKALIGCKPVEFLNGELHPVVRRVLHKCNLEEYIPMFIAERVSLEAFLIADDNDLKQWGIMDLSRRKTLRKACSELIENGSNR